MRPTPHAFPFHSVVYWDDVETEGRWQTTLSMLREAEVEDVCFYYIREHEIAPHPPLERLQGRLARHATCAAHCREHGMHVSVGLVPSLAWGQAVSTGHFQKIVAPDGIESGSGSCPLDTELRAYLQAAVSAIGAAGFTAISLEDDFQHDNHRPARGGCFCPLHLKAFGQRRDQAWTRQDLVAALAIDPELQADWQTFKHEVLVELAQELLRELQKSQPEGCLLLLGGPHMQQVAAALPFAWYRPPQGYYDDRPHQAVKAAWTGYANSRQVPADYRPPLLAEITGWPRNAAYKSWTTMGQQAAICAFLGFDGALFWAGLGHRDPGFSPFARTWRPMLDQIAAEIAAFPQQAGLPITIDDNPWWPPPAALSLARMGLPVRLCLPGEADSPLLDQPDLDALGLLEPRAPDVMFSAERFSEDPINGNAAGLCSTSLTFLQCAEMRYLQADGRVLASYVDSNSQPLTPSLMLDNRGRLLANYSASTWERLISPQKAAQLAAALTSLPDHPVPAFMRGGCNTLLFVRQDQTRSGLLLLLVHQSPDPLQDWDLQVTGQRPTIQHWSDGRWEDLPEATWPVLPPFAVRLFRIALG